MDIFQRKIRNLQKAIEKQREEDRMNYLLNRKALYNRGIRHGSVNRMIVHKVII